MEVLTASMPMEPYKLQNIFFLVELHKLLLCTSIF